MHTHYNWEGAVGQGWRSLVQPLIELCEQHDVLIMQVKEKYGGLRYYIGSANKEFFDAIDAAEKESYKTCEQCGEPGVLRDDLGWISTLCDKHYQDRLNRTTWKTDWSK